VAKLRLKPAGPEFLFMVNHLYRSNTDRRHEQAGLLNAWARSQTLPVIAVGDYNFDWDVSNGDTVHDRGYDLLIADGVLTWIRPPQLIRTQCSFNNVPDFVFVAGSARQWRASSEILATQESYCPSDQNRSDHRPVLAMFELAPDGQPNPRPLLLAQIQRLEAQVSALKALVEQMPE
jgi:endonuclease/exonuclease/phosphatase family metal-dependent hydrolase